MTHWTAICMAWGSWNHAKVQLFCANCVKGGEEHIARLHTPLVYNARCGNARRSPMACWKYYRWKITWWVDILILGYQWVVIHDYEDIWWVWLHPYHAILKWSHWKWKNRRFVNTVALPMFDVNDGRASPYNQLWKRWNLPNGYPVNPFILDELKPLWWIFMKQIWNMNGIINNP